MSYFSWGKGTRCAAKGTENAPHCCCLLTSRLSHIHDTSPLQVYMSMCCTTPWAATILFLSELWNNIKSIYSSGLTLFIPSAVIQSRVAQWASCRELYTDKFPLFFCSYPWLFIILLATTDFWDSSMFSYFCSCLR